MRLIIIAIWGVSYKSIRIVLEVWCKIQSLIFNKDVVVKNLKISMASYLLQLTVLMHHTLFI